MSKQQRLRNMAEGFLAGLVMAGFLGPFRWASHEWEDEFYFLWRDWPPASRNPNVFQPLEMGGSANGRTSQAREILWQVKRTSPFHGFDEAPLPREPMGLTPAEYVDIWVKGASPDEWKDLAIGFLASMEKRAGE